jgi:hypothetical protein
MRNRHLFIGLLALALGATAAAEAPTPSALPRTAAPADAKVYFISPKNGETIKGPVTVRFGLSGMGVAPAGTVAEGTGHHHLIVDAPLPAMDQPLPKDATHQHFGKGQTETVLTLAPGKHTLQLVLGDANHIPHDPPVVSEQITITVK